MLYTTEDREPIQTIPHRADYDRWRARLSDSEYEAIMAVLSERIGGTEVQTSSWIPGSDWTGTVFQPIWEKACLRNGDQAALFFGLLVWETFMKHEGHWFFGRYELNGVPIRGLTYFRGTIS
ncbi:MAG TPA: hypothetical protein VGB22_10480 [candidate division Zixibacteria bacterium]|jgi:hypothetical protein